MLRLHDRPALTAPRPGSTLAVMPIAFPCAHCLERVVVSRKHAGRKGLCPKCKGLNVVPGADAPHAKVTASAEDQPLDNTLAGPAEPDPVDAVLEAERVDLHLERAKLDLERAALARERSAVPAAAAPQPAQDLSEESGARRTRRRRLPIRPPSSSSGVIIVVALVVGLGALYMARKSTDPARLVENAVRGLEGQYVIDPSGQRVTITSNTIEFYGRGSDLYEHLGDGRVLVKPTNGGASTVYRWGWRGGQLWLWDAAMPESFATKMTPR